MNISDGESSLHDISEDNKSDNVANNHHSDPIQTTDNDEGIDIETTPDSYHSFQVTTNEKNRLHSIEKVS